MFSLNLPSKDKWRYYCSRHSLCRRPQFAQLVVLSAETPPLFPGLKTAFVHICICEVCDWLLLEKAAAHKLRRTNETLAASPSKLQLLQTSAAVSSHVAAIFFRIAFAFLSRLVMFFLFDYLLKMIPFPPLSNHNAGSTIIRHDWWSVNVEKCFTTSEKRPHVNFKTF